MAGAAEGIGTIAVLIVTVCYTSGVFRGVGPTLDRDVNEHRLATSTLADRTAASISEREALIARFIADGVLTRVDMAAATHEVFTGPAWAGLSLEIQQSVIGQLAALYADVDSGFFYLRDGRSGESLGAFRLQAGDVLTLR